MKASVERYALRLAKSKATSSIVSAAGDEKFAKRRTINIEIF